MLTKIIETPRDAMQGIVQFIPTEQKIKYINALLEVGFDEVDFSSFVSPKAIPQLRDSDQVLESLNLKNTNSRIMATIGNLQGGERALAHDAVGSLAFPFSISEIFLEKNIRSSFEKGIETIKGLLDLCNKKEKELIVYIAMAFGNPYGEDWSIDILKNWVSKLQKLGLKTIILADTTGDGTPKNISETYKALSCKFPDLEIGIHLHTTLSDWERKVSGAYYAGCRRFDAAIGGFGGCPMSGKELVGNLSTDLLVEFLLKQGEELDINTEALARARALAAFTFPS